MCSAKTSSLPVPDRHIHISGSLYHGPGHVSDRFASDYFPALCHSVDATLGPGVIDVITYRDYPQPDHLLFYFAHIYPRTLSSEVPSSNSLRLMTSVGIYPYSTLVNLHPYHYRGALWNAEYQFYRYGFDCQLLDRYASACQSCPTLARVDGNGHRRFGFRLVNYRHDHSCFLCCQSSALAQAVKDHIHNLYL